MSGSLPPSRVCVCAARAGGWLGAGVVRGDRLTGSCVFLGLEGTAEAREPLYEGAADDEVDGRVEVDGDGTAALGKTVAEKLSAAGEGIGWFTKLAIFAVIVGVCGVFVKSHAPRRTGYAGRHGAYEKSGLP